MSPDDDVIESEEPGRVVSRDDTTALTRNSEEATELGRELMGWWSRRAADVNTFALSAKGKHLIEMKAFFDTMESRSGTTSVMGCIQRARFPIREGLAAEAPLETFLKANYAVNATWSRAGGRPAGFGYEALLYKEKNTGKIGRFGNGRSPAALDLTPVGSAFEWMMLRVEIHDFLRATPMKPIAGWLSRYIKEAAYVVSHEIFSAPVGEPPPGTVAECLFGYSFLPCACVAGPFGFGPGHFRSAIKLFRFSLLESSELEIKLSFIVAPRSTKVLNLRGFDPVYSTLHLFNALTLGLLRVKATAHDALDKNFMTVHGRAHHDLVTGMEAFWTGQRWVA